MIPKRIIEKAIEGGWLKDASILGIYENDISRFYSDYLQNGKSIRLYAWAVCSPDFWQALGKALGLREEIAYSPFKAMCPEWEYRAMEFYRLILTNGDTEKFWNGIIPTP